MVHIVVNELEGFKGKLQETIDHVKSGVGQLSEDQRATAMLLLADLEEKLSNSLDKCFDILRPEKPAGVQLIDLKPEGEPVSGSGQPVPEPLKSVVDEQPSDGPEVVYLPSSWTQRDSQGREVEVHVESPGKYIAQPTKE
jgi:hypothetical protein